MLTRQREEAKMTKTTLIEFVISVERVVIEEWGVDRGSIMTLSSNILARRLGGTNYYP